MHRMHPLHLNTDSMSAEEAEQWGTELAEYQRAINWWLGDLAVYARKHLGDNYTQVFPEWVSPGLIQRCEAVSKAYAPEGRNQLATWTIHMKHANHPQRIQKVQEAVDAGRTSDEERRAAAEAGRAGTHGQPADGNRWLLAVDVNYFLHRFWYSGAGVEAAASVATWVQRTAARLQERGLTDVACCLDSPQNHRKELTTEWGGQVQGPATERPGIGPATQPRPRAAAGSRVCVCQDRRVRSGRRYGILRRAVSWQGDAAHTRQGLPAVSVFQVQYAA